MTTSTPQQKIPAILRSTAGLLTLIFFMHGMMPMAIASPIPSTLISMEDARAADIATIQKSLETKIVQDRLEQLGFTPAEIEERLLYADDAELHQLAVHSETMMAGGGGGIIVTVLVIVLLVILIQRIAATDTNPQTQFMA